jgi:heme/copper-type cytochrome/quinol oxidase subunit 2
MIRDIAIIVFTSIFSIVVVVIGVLIVRLYRTVHRTAENAEVISGSIRAFVTVPINPIHTLTELGNYLLGWIREYRAKQRRNEDDET